MAKTTNVIISVNGEILREEVLDARLSGLKDLIRSETDRHGSVKLGFDDFSSFRKHPQKLSLLDNERVSFSFENFSSLNPMNLGFIITALTVGKNQERNDAIKKTLKDKKAKGKPVGNKKIGNVRSHAIRHRSNNALKKTNLKTKGSATSLAQLVVNYIDGKDWSFNRLANFLSDAQNRAKLQFATDTRKFYPNTIKDIYNRNQRYMEETLPANMQGIKSFARLPEEGKTVESLDEIEQLIGVERGRAFDDTLKFSVRFLNNQPFSLLFLETKLQKFKGEYAPYETKHFPANTQEVEVDLDELAILPGTYLLSIKIDGEDTYAMEDFPVILRDHLVAHLDPTVIEAVEAN